MVDVVVLERDELAFRRGAEPHLLLGARAMTAVWNVILRLSTSLTGLPSCRAAATASGQCVHGQSLLPKPEPTNLVMTRTFSFGKPNICASTPRMLKIPCDSS